MPQQPEFHRSIEQLDPDEWNALGAGSNPFTRHEFLSALERTHCVGRAAGWEPHYLTLSDAGGLAAAAAAFVKTHSFGEFVFDFAWARAYERVGRRYYPKLTLAAPFTPATGPRLLVRADLDSEAFAARLLERLEEHAASHGLSGVHALFLDEPARAACLRRGWLLRRDCQFHWINRGYASFDDYLATFTAEKRKKARRERRRVAEAGVRFETRFGGELDEPLLERVYALHRDTFLRHGHEPYLTRAFFGEAARVMPESFMVKLAVHGRAVVAAAIFFWCEDALFGRYWGADADYHSLHFEACYHQGIEFCIERRIARFEPGTQGEHKVSRGFEPALTWSAHYIVDPQFRPAIADYLTREAGAVEAYALEVQAHVPYRGRRTAGGGVKTITWLSPQDEPEWFPPLEQALEEPSGLLAAGGDLSPARLIAAYRRGIFPWYSPGQPVLWWSPDPRAVLFPEEFHRTRSLAKTLRNGGFDFSRDRDFVAVIDGCAAPRAGSPGTWITSDMRAAYLELHRLGHAHSIEVWRAGSLAGGLYGVRLGGVFFGESMFSRERDASKAALARLVELCRRNGLAVIDCQLPSRHLESLGSRSIPRSQFQALLREHVRASAPPLVDP